MPSVRDRLELVLIMIDGVKMNSALWHPKLLKYVSEWMKEERESPAPLAVDHVKEQVSKKLKQIEADERFHYPPANVLINAPLALIQVDLHAQHQTLTWVLSLKNEKEVYAK